MTDHTQPNTTPTTAINPAVAGKQEVEESKQSSETSLDILRRSISVRAQILFPNDANPTALEQYNLQRTTFARNYMGQPSIIIVCHGTKDVQAAIKYCRMTNADFTVAGGRHSAYACM